MSAGVQGESVARNYAEALLALAHKANDTAGWGDLIRQISDAITGDVQLSRFLESPRISAEQKSAVISKAFGSRVPRIFLRYLLQLVHNRRQMLIPQIAAEYETLRDAESGIVHARVAVAQPTGESERNMIAERLSAALGKSVVPHLEVDPSILGGVVVRVGDTVMDGSLRRKLALLRRGMTRMRA